MPGYQTGTENRVHTNEQYYETIERYELHKIKRFPDFGPNCRRHRQYYLVVAMTDRRHPETGINVSRQTGLGGTKTVWIKHHLRILGDLPDPDEEPFTREDLENDYPELAEAYISMRHHNIIEHVGEREDPYPWEWRFPSNVRTKIDELLSERDAHNPDNPLPCGCAVVAFENNDGTIHCHECDGEWPRHQIGRNRAGGVADD